VIAVDTNILVYAHRSDMRLHGPAVQVLGALLQSGLPWAVPWPCFHEFVGNVTHPRIHAPPTPLDVALQAVAAWLAAPNITVLSEGENHWRVLDTIAAAGGVVGPMIHDARIAAICIEHGVSALWSADRDFRRFPSLKVVNPLAGR
jgi:toxin-antitoxin system PIN domain toxin